MISFRISKILQSAQGAMPLDIFCEIQNGQLATIYGASGSGKTTILRILAGLLQPESGKIVVNGDVWFDSENNVNLAAQKRKIGIVFQDYALFPNLTVRQNLEYALARNKEAGIVDELITVMDLQQLSSRPPTSLSGGQKQRVALARALVRKPTLLLLDEPLSALDNEMRGRLQDHIIKVHRQFHLTTLLVSHDIAEIFKMSDKIFVLENGMIIKHGSPHDIFFNKEISGKFQFIGEVLNIEREDIIYVVSVLINNTVVRVAATDVDVKGMGIGDKVTVSSKAFNPLIRKIDIPLIRQ